MHTLSTASVHTTHVAGQLEGQGGIHVATGSRGYFEVLYRDISGPLARLGLGYYSGRMPAGVIFIPSRYS